MNQCLSGHEDPILLHRHQHCWVALQNFRGYQPEIRTEYSELLHTIGPDVPTLGIRT